MDAWNTKSVLVTWELPTGNLDINYSKQIHMYRDQTES